MQLRPTMPPVGPSWVNFVGQNDVFLEFHQGVSALRQVADRHPCVLDVGVQSAVGLGVELGGRVGDRTCRSSECRPATAASKLCEEGSFSRLVLSRQLFEHRGHWPMVALRAARPCRAGCKAPGTATASHGALAGCKPMAVSTERGRGRPFAEATTVEIAARRNSAGGW
jgi:hypothetical protein